MPPAFWWITWSAKYCTPASIVPIPAACTTQHSSSARNGAFAEATHSWAARLGSASDAVRDEAFRVPRKVATVPTAMSRPTNNPDHRWPVRPPPVASTTSGAIAPEIRMATARTATRQVIRRVRSA